jgi:signal peptidase I
VSDLGKKFAEGLVDFFEILIIAVFVFVLVYLFIGQLLEVSGDSMIPNFHDKEQIIAEKLSIKFKPLQRGEIVIFRHPDEPDHLLIKRLVGLPNETIKLEDGFVYINGERLSEPYVLNGGPTPGGNKIEEGMEYKIAYDTYVFLGDNREESTDSRAWGAVPTELIVGRGLLVYYPLDSFRAIK